MHGAFSASQSNIMLSPHLKISSFGIDFTIHGPAAGRMAAEALTQPVRPPPSPPSPPLPPLPATSPAVLPVCTRERAGAASSGRQEGGMGVEARTRAARL